MTTTKTDKVVFFDCYQTLLDVRLDKEQQKVDEQKGWEKFVSLLNERGIQVDVATLLALLEKRKVDFYSTRDKKLYHHSFYALIGAVLKEDLGAEVPADDLVGLVYEYRKIARGSVRLYPKVANTLAQLAQQYMLAISSYTQGSFTQLELRELGIEQYFSYFIYSSGLGIRKETNGFYEECLRVVGKDAADCVMIGDHYREDILPSRKAGLNAIWIRNPATLDKFSDIDISTAGESIALEAFDTLPQVVEKLFAI